MRPQVSPWCMECLSSVHNTKGHLAVVPMRVYYHPSDTCSSKTPWLSMGYVRATLRVKALGVCAQQIHGAMPDLSTSLPHTLFHEQASI